MLRFRQKRTGSRPRRWFLLFIAGATLAAAVWRFASASLSVDAIVPYLEGAVADAVPGLEVDIGGLSLTWAGWRRGIDLLARDTRIAAGDAEVRIPEVLLKLSLRALARGRLAPTQVELVGVSGKLVRERDGTIRLIALGGGREQPVGETALERLLAELGSEPDPRRPLSYMRTLGLRDATVTFEDRSLAVTWDARDIDVHLFSALDTAVAGEFRAGVALDEHVAVLDGSLAFDAAAHALRVDATFADVPADAVTARLPPLRDAFRLQSLVGGSVAVEVTLAGRLREVRAEIGAAPGTLTVPGVLDRPEPVRELRASGRFLAEERSWSVDPVRVGLGTATAPGATLVLRADATPADDGTAIAASLEVTDLGVDDLVRYWPPSVDPGTRKWIDERIDRGRVRELQATATVRLPAEDAAAPGVDALEARFRYEGLRVRWGDAAPPVAGIDGTATFAERALRFAIERGSVGAMRLDSARVDLTNLGRDPGHIRVEIDGNGPLAAILRAIDLSPPEFLRTPPPASDLGAAFATARGSVEFDMQKHLNIDDLAIDVEAQLRDVPVDSDLARGTTAGRLRVAAREGTFELDGDLDLRGLEAEQRALGWRRVPGDPGTASFALSIEGGHPRELRRFSVDTKGLRTSGRGVYAAGGGALATLALRDLESGRTSLRRVDMTWEADVLRVDLADGSADLRPLFGAPDTFAPGDDGRGLAVSAQDLARVEIEDDAWLEHVSGRLHRDRSGWRAFDLRATTPAYPGGNDAAPARALHVGLEPAADPSLRTATLAAMDFGGLVRALGWGRAVAGGSLRITSGDLRPDLGAGTLQVNAERFSVADAPLAVRLLSLASLDSLVAALQGGNLFFDDLESTVGLDGAQLELQEMRASGSSLGWVVRGKVDLDRDVLDLEGTLIPAYTANRLLKTLPVLREVIVGEGILAVDFGIDGPLAEPDIDTAPLSAITPELLRRVFGRAVGRLRPAP